MSHTKIYIQRTQGELDFLDKKAKELGKSDIHSYIRCGISKLQKEYVACPDCVTPAKGEKRTVKHSLPEHQINELLEISKKMGKPLSAIIDEFIITPLLRQDKDAAL